MVRFACRDCPRVGRYRLAVLAERCGADTDLEDVLAAISANCPRHRESHLGRRCRAYYPDLPPPRPPALAEDLRRRRRGKVGRSRSREWMHRTALDVPVDHHPAPAVAGVPLGAARCVFHALMWFSASPRRQYTSS